MKGCLFECGWLHICEDLRLTEAAAHAYVDSDNRVWCGCGATEDPMWGPEPVPDLELLGQACVVTAVCLVTPALPPGLCALLPFVSITPRIRMKCDKCCQEIKTGDNRWSCAHRSCGVDICESCVHEMRKAVAN